MRLPQTLAVCFALVAVLPACAQDRPPPKYEFRASWIATVANLDWPVRGASSASQQDDLTDMLDGLNEVGINAVFLQVRSEADAMYDSDIEPWSYWLTGTQGEEPDPYWDPLEFAIAEAHVRGMELHAWFNPFRAARYNYERTDDHVTVQHPEWILEFDDLKILNPGLPDVRDYVTGVIMDVVWRYDIDGIHFDDYFYPYPPNNITDEDEQTHQDHGRGIDDIGDWRRDNVNLFVVQVADSIRAVKPEVAYGVSPFGIWKNGVPEGIVGLDAYNVIFADPLAWIEDESIDYLVPQLYWPFGGDQDYEKLAPWWLDQIGSLHLYIGHGLYRADPNTNSGTLFAPEEVPEQVRFNRLWPDMRGSSFFRAKNLTDYHSQGFSDTLKSDLYRHRSLTPPMAWKDETAPEAPSNLRFEWTGTTEATLEWDAASESAPYYAIYRVLSESEPDPGEAYNEARNLLAVTSRLSVTDHPGMADDPWWYFVTGVSENSIESDASNMVSLEGRATFVERDAKESIVRFVNYPNPFRERTLLVFELERPAYVRLRVFDVLGRVVATLIDGEWMGAVEQSYHWEAIGLRSGLYFAVLETDTRTIRRHIILAK